MVEHVVVLVNSSNVVQVVVLVWEVSFSVVHVVSHVVNSELFVRQEVVHVS